MLLQPIIIKKNYSSLLKNLMLGRWQPWSFTNPIWHSATLCLHWSAIMPSYFHLL